MTSALRIPIEVAAGPGARTSTRHPLAKQAARASIALHKYANAVARILLADRG
jgi:hypothetical protein